jgi:CubicO group peptidase (beta-lactamase class C family)
MSDNSLFETYVNISNDGVARNDLEACAMRLTRRSITTLAATAPWLSSTVWAQSSSSSFAAQARRGVEAIQKGRGVKGVAAALLVDGAPIWMETFGDTGGPTSRPIGLDTIFSVQSTSKHMAATAVMMAVKRGLVDLDRPLTDYLPDFTVNSRHEMEPQRRMTLRLLLSHRAGFTHDAPVGSNYVVEARPDFRAHIDSIQRTWLRFPVGERYAYSNLGIDLAGHVLQRVTGLSYPEILRRWIFEPLGMESTTADGDVYEARRNRAIGHVAGFDEIPVRLPFVPAGGVYSSVSDMAKYAQFHLRRGASERGQLLDRSLWAEMHDFRYGANYALGVGRRRPLRLERGTFALLTHNGGGFGFGCTFLYCPTEGVAWIALYNAAMDDDPFNEIMPQPVLEARHGRPLPPPQNPRPVVRLSRERLHARAGLYMNRDSRCIASVEDESLTLEFKDRRGANRLAFLSTDEAWVVDGLLRGDTVKFYPAVGLRAASFAFTSGDRWDFIDGPSVEPGPVGSEYDDRLGRYAIEIWGKPVAQVTLSKRNGWLYYEDIRLAPFLRGLFFSGAGEALDLRGAIPTARNIPLHRIAAA